MPSIKADKWIKRMALEHGMIEPFEDRQVRQGVISYGLSSYGYDIRVADEFKVFTNINNTVVDPKNFDDRSFVDMRGRTLNDAFVILDEAQNTTSEQMKMFLTRLGFGSKAVVTGDITQIDLPNPRTSGLVEALRIVKDIEGIGFIYFDDTDVVRHKLVQQIVKAYDALSAGRTGDGR